MVWYVSMFTFSKHFRSSILRIIRQRWMKSNKMRVHTQLLSHVWLCGLMECNPDRILCPWNFPGKNFGVCCHFLFRGSSWPPSPAYFSSVTQLCLTLCDPMDCTLGFPVHHKLLKLAPSSQWCHRTISSSVIPFLHLQSCPTSGSFPMSQCFASGDQSIGDSASASVLPTHTHTHTQAHTCF